MHAPHFLSESFKLFISRVTLSKLTICYFTFSVVHCIIQVSLQGHALSTNSKAATFLWDVVEQGDAKVQGVLNFGAGLQLCNTIEDALSLSSCQLVWNGTAADSVQPTPLSSTSSISPAYSTTSTLLPPSSLPPATSSSSSTMKPTSRTISVPSPSLSTTSYLARPSPTLPTTSTGVVILMGSRNSEEPDVNSDRRPQRPRSIPRVETVVQNDAGNLIAALNDKCLIALNWPAAALDNTKREDIVFITFQFWVLGMSTVAILNESIPHIIASLFTHMLATSWGAFQIVNTNEFQTDFSRLITNGACRGVNILPAYWGPRRAAEVSSLALNALALLVATFLSWRLTKAFGWRTFKRIGASIQIRTQYRAVLILSITIQLAFFFIVASAGLWLDQLINGVISHMTARKAGCEVLTVMILVLLVPWLALGWISVRKEQRILMAIFLSLSALYLANWGAMFAGASFRWTFLEWRFFSVMTSASVALTFSALITGIVCRLGFGKGLPEHLNETRHMEDEDILFTPHTQDDASEISAEKVEFPPLGFPVPTFSAAFRSDEEDEFSEKPQCPTPQMGPRFFYASSIPFDQRTVLEPAPALSRQHSFKTIPHVY